MRLLPFVALLSPSINAFAPPTRQHAAVPKQWNDWGSASTSNSAMHAIGPNNLLLALGEGSFSAKLADGLTGSAEASSSDSLSPLMTYFLESLISNGVPALFSILVIGFAAFLFGKSRKGDREDLLETANPVAQLYDDLYGDQNQVVGNAPPLGPFGPMMDKKKLPRNAGVPAKEYIKITNLNRQLDSYQYSLKAATGSKAAAAAEFRQASFGRALGMALDGPIRQELLQAEAQFLKEGAALTSKITDIQAKLTQVVVDEELESFGMESVYDLDPAFNETAMCNETAIRISKKSKSSREGQLSALGKLQRDLQELELDFIQNVVQTVGPAYGASVRTVLLGDVAVRGSGGLLHALQDRPLKSLLSDEGSEDAPKKPGNLFVTRFPGDASASQVATLREEATAIIRSAKAGKDEVLLVLQTGGGTVTGYGLAAAQLLRFKDAGLKLTVAVEQVAASGGYMMCCVADKIVASPFAVLGSIGVISDIPNVYDRLKSEGIEFQTVTAGKYKRTLTPTKKVTREDFQKTKEDIAEILMLFKDFVAQNRPQLDIDDVATGETWFGTAALEKKLCDEIKTVDDVLIDYIDDGFGVYEVKYEPPVENPLGKLVLGGASAPWNDSSNGSFFQRGVRWVVRSIAEEVRAEVSCNLSSPRVERRYMAQDGTSSRIRSD